MQFCEEYRAKTTMLFKLLPGVTLKERMISYTSEAAADPRRDEKKGDLYGSGNPSRSVDCHAMLK
jgi:hypothetical protein